MRILSSLTNRIFLGSAALAVLTIAVAVYRINVAVTVQAENELRRHASLLALELAEKKLKARMSPEVDASLVERFVAGLGAVSRN